MVTGVLMKCGGEQEITKEILAGDVADRELRSVSNKPSAMAGGRREELSG